MVSDSVSISRTGTSRTGIRRFLAFAYFLAGGVLIAWALRRAELDPQRAVLVGIVTVVGGAVGLLVGCGYRFSISTFLRVISLVLVGILILATLAAWRHHTQQTMPEDRLGNAAMRLEIQNQVDSLLPLALAIAYAGLCLIFIPTSARRPIPAHPSESLP